jgi:hypothetical protein
VAGAVALAAALAALFLAVGFWIGQDRLDFTREVAMQPTGEAPSAAALIRLGERDERGNWELELDVSGLPALPEGGYYILWLAKDGEYAGTCGTFNVGADGASTVRMNGSYVLDRYDEWVVTAWLPEEPGDDQPWLLHAATT